MGDRINESGCPPTSQGEGTAKLDRGGEARPGSFLILPPIAGDAPTRRAHGDIERCHKSEGNTGKYITTRVIYPPCARLGQMDWTDDKIETLRWLWDQGVPTAEIGRRMNAGKNSVIGKAHRLGLTKRNQPAALVRVQRQETAARLVERHQNPDGCRYIIGDPANPGWRYCQQPQGKRRDGTQSDYCQEHHDRCHIPNLAEKAA